jgi:hypothetical protein
MNKALNITNGDCALKIMEEAGIEGKILPWRDVLHEGPVPADLSLEKLSFKRAEFLASLSWGDFDKIHKNFLERNTCLQSFHKYSQVILWFEHDLYDQLQILQILDWFARHPPYTQLHIICTDQYLGRATPQQMLDLQQHITPVTAAHLQLAQKAWKAFRSATPQLWFNLLSENTSELKFLNFAILRQLEEYPSTHNGLSRTANSALMLLNQGEIKPAKLFALYMQTEERVFMGDSSFWLILNQLLQAPCPLIKVSSGNQITLPANTQTISITDTGKAVLNGTKNWLDIIEINQWIGGVELTANNYWLWDTGKQQLQHLKTE